MLTMKLVPTVCLGSFGSFDEAYAEGKSRFESQDYSGAQEAFNAALELAPESTQQAAARAGLADCLLEFQDYDGCRALAEQTLEDVSGQPDWPQANALRQIAESYRREKRFEEMTATIDRAGHWNAGLVDWLNLATGAMCYREQLWEQSEQFHRDALASQDKGTRGWALYWLARTAQETGQKEQALDHLEQFRQLELNDDHMNGIANALREELESSGR